ncbi:NAD-dependent epimerase/dehydratase family protein [Kribbella turkmenica]|uniref:NAD-dependent epimerase/dehydratase family protein n=1 Tax=Kribbella turkmenica TaxID=2530375 RepID=A0A4R4WY82_9ACTN|nr:NAD(P)H-binding protein [Kribbella turkmenica]TDD22794.1 NAD-dependent epimerase/dehydratase family protein [Kribbella turkmenica]
MIVVTGATGNVGRPLIAALAAAGEQVAAVSRTIPAGESGPASGAGGVRRLPADLTEPESLKPALDGAEAAFLLTAPGFLASGDLGKVLTVVRAAGVRRVVLLSSQGVGTQRHPSNFEDAVAMSGLEWTILRPGNFSSNAFQWADSVRTRRVLEAPFADVALPAVDPADIAEVAAAVLREPGHTGSVYTLTGPEPVSPRQQSDAIANAVGEPVEFVELTRAEARSRMLTFMPEPVVESTLGILGTPTAAERSVSPDTERLLGRPATTFADWAKSNVAAFS